MRPTVVFAATQKLNDFAIPNDISNEALAKRYSIALFLQPSFAPVISYFFSFSSFCSTFLNPNLRAAYTAGTIAVLYGICWVTSRT
jgi:hypothetical protein